MENLKGSILISTKDIQIIEDCCSKIARKELIGLRDAIGKEKVTVKDYCNYWQLDMTDVINCLNKYR